MREITRAAAIILAVLILTASSAMAMSEAEEIELGRKTAMALEAKYGVLNNHPQLDRVRRIGYGIAAVTERSYLNFTFKILNTNIINAMACPGGFVYVTNGILPILTDDELAFVMAHEIAHVAKKHGIRQMKKNTLTQLGLSGIALALNKGKKSSDLTNKALGAVSTVASCSYSRGDENEADITACHYIEEIGYNPRAGISFMKKLKASTKQSKTSDFLNGIIGDHPLTDDRIKNIDAECVKMGY